MNKIRLNETIAASATPINIPSAIGIIRVSGNKSLEIVKKIFKFKTNNFEIKPRYMYHGFIINPANNETIDEAMICFYKAPMSYTGEDMVEFFCHGGSYNLSKILNLIYSCGAIPALAGEFTMRACINGKIDLCRAEAICDLINAKTNAFHKVAISQLKGNLSNTINEIRSELVDILADIEANLDFPEDDVEPINLSLITEKLKLQKEKILNLISTYDYGKILRNGINITIIGTPNVGKSSLFNLLIRENRAIVTEIPGTTRDVIEELVNINGVIFNISDTAGIRTTQDIVEKIGIDKTFETLNKSDICLLVLDASRKINDDDILILNKTYNMHRILIINKIDIKSPDFNINNSYLQSNEKIVEISVIQNINIDKLIKTIANYIEQLTHFESINESNIITNARHATILQNVLLSYNDALNTINQNQPIDLLTIDIRSILSQLGEIVGETLTEDILNRIFEKFCIGK